MVIKFFLSVSILLFFILSLIAYANLITTTPTSADRASTDIAYAACDAGSLDSDNAAYCGNTLSIDSGNEWGYVNSTHSSSIAEGSTLTDVFICWSGYFDAKSNDAAGDASYVRVAENSSTPGSWTYTNVASCIGTACTFTTDTMRCYNVTSIINTIDKARHVRISLWHTESDDAAQDIFDDYNYVNVTYNPPVITLRANGTISGPTTIGNGQSTVFQGNCEATGGAGNGIYVWLQNSTDNVTFGNTSTSSTQIVYTNITSYFINSLTNANSTKYDFQINVTKLGTYYFRIQCNSSNAVPSPANSTSSTLTVNQAYGWLNVTLNEPLPDSSNATSQNSTFVLNATIACLHASNNPTAVCGNVNGTARYNSSGNEPNEVISTTGGATPFYIMGATNPQTCGNMNVSLSPCNLNWTINATGDIDTKWYVDVNFTSNETSIASNGTANAQINITGACAIAIGLSSNLSSGIQWNVTSLPADNLAAIGNNDVTLYNISIQITGSCQADLYIKANGNLTSNGNRIGLGNETYCYNTMDNTVPGTACTELTSEYVNIGSNLNNDDYSYLKFYLDVPSAQTAGNYNNTVYIKGVVAGGTP